MSLGSGLISQYGIRTTYLLLGILSGLVGTSYFVTYKLFLKNVEERRLAAHSISCLPKDGSANGDVRNSDETLGLKTAYSGHD